MQIIPTTYVAYHCRECGYQCEMDVFSYSYPYNCPKCHEAATTSGPPILPVNSVSRDKHPKQYDFLGGPPEIQVYLVSFSGLQASKCFDPDVVPDLEGDAIEVAEEILRLCKKRYLFSGQVPKIEKVIEDMKKNQEQSRKNEVINRLNRLRRDIVSNIAEYNELLNEG